MINFLEIGNNAYFAALALAFLVGICWLLMKTNKIELSLTVYMFISFINAVLSTLLFLVMSKFVSDAFAVMLTTLCLLTAAYYSLVTSIMIIVKNFKKIVK